MFRFFTFLTYMSSLMKKNMKFTDGGQMADHYFCFYLIFSFAMLAVTSVSRKGFGLRFIPPFHVCF